MVYSISKPGITNLSKGVYKNKLKLYKGLKEFSEKGNYKVKFDGIIGFKNKKFNYNNLILLLKSINKNESFGIFMENKNNSLMFEISKMDENTLNL